jgi:Carbohydrate esterase, sialic acid-specific acetylesterase
MSFQPLTGLVLFARSDLSLKGRGDIAFRSLPMRMLALLLIFSAAAYAEEKPRSITAPDDKPGAAGKPVQVYILMGQSNMVGMGDIGPETTKGTLQHLTKTDKKYAYLVNGDKWTERKDVYYYDARTKKGAPLGPLANNGKAIGPELGFGYVMGQVTDEPVLVLKSCIGNRSLGWDLLPPGSKQYTYEGKTYAGYKDTPDSWVEGQPKKEVAWYAGKQYDDDMTNAKTALKDMAKWYPGGKDTKYEIAGFVYWQGHKDTGNKAHTSKYEENLERLIDSLRKDYDAPKAKFVLATGCGNPGKVGPGKTIAEAQLAMNDTKKYPKFEGNVKAVDTREFWREAADSPKDQGYHYNRNAETYMETGLALGWAMAELLKK